MVFSGLSCLEVVDESPSMDGLHTSSQFERLQFHVLQCSLVGLQEVVPKALIEICNLYHSICWLGHSN